ncbi:MAG: hypothetical protein ABIK43_02375 [candidate division WOR-3 bacterium]
MSTLRVLAVIELIVAGVLMVGQFETERAERSAMIEDIRHALAMPGTGLCAMTDAQARDLTGRIERQLAGSCRGYTMSEFVATLELMRRTGAATTVRIYAGDRSLLAICRELGDLMLREQRQRTITGEHRIDELVQVLVAGELRLAELARLHQVNKEVLLNAMATGTDILIGGVRLGWL